MNIYNDNLNKYFQPCINCGECCKVPGVFIPEQIDILAKHFNLSRRQLFDRCLIAEFCAPNDSCTPVFVLSPVKVDASGNRLPQKMFDTAYINIRDLNCIFRDIKANRCSIHDYKPFACSLLLCPKMTKDKSISLEKSFYYHKWKETQEIVFSMFPGLDSIYAKLNESVTGMGKSLDLRNNIINNDIAILFNGHPISGMPIYR